MNSLNGLYEEIMANYAASAETEMGFLLLVEWLRKNARAPGVPKSPTSVIPAKAGIHPRHGARSRPRKQSNTPPVYIRRWILGVDASSPVQLGIGDPNLSSTRYQYEATFEELLRNSSEGGRNVRLGRHGTIAHTYALWEEEYRAKIATECGLANKNDVRSDIFQDLNYYRQAILKRGGQLDRHPTEMHFFAKGDVVAFTKDQMRNLFAQLVQELNRIGREYYGCDPEFTLDKPLH